MSTINAPGALNQSEVTTLRKEDVFRWAEELLRKSVVVKDKKGRDLEAHIKAVQPFTGLKEGSPQEKVFQEKQRVQGETFVLFFRGKPQLYVVVDPLAQRIVWAKELEFNGQKTTFEGLLKEAGFDRYAMGDDYKPQIVDTFDGSQAMSEAYEGPLKIRSPKQESLDVVTTIRRSVAKVAPNCLGEFRRV